jgi:two-component system, NarL family, nitrate/nitrite response regulator NarL
LVGVQGADEGHVRVFVVAEVRLYEQGLAQAFERDERFIVAGTASSADEGIARMRRLDPSPDVAVVDLSGPGCPAAVMAMRDGVPELKVIALGIRELESEVIPLVEAGADGFVTPKASLDELMETVESVARGEALCSPRMTAALLRHVSRLARERQPAHAVSSLTARESEIAGLIDEGLSNKEIAQRLRIELPTVKNHVHNLLEKLGVRRRGEAAAAWRGDRGRERSATSEPRGFSAGRF